MPVPQKAFGKGRMGTAMVSIVGDKVHVTFEDNGQTITVLLADAPSYIRQGKQAITMNTSNTEIYGARPVGGTHRARFVGFTAKENEPPLIREVASRSGVSQAGKKYSIKAHLEFTALFDITAGKWKNYRLVHNLTYGFERYSPPNTDPDMPDSDEAITLVYGAKLAEFLVVCGMDFEIDSIPWSDNVLVYLEKLLLSRRREVAVSIDDKGWIKDIGEIPAEDGEEDEDDQASVDLPKEDKATLKEKTAKLTNELYGTDPDADEKPAKKEKKQAMAPTVLDILATQAKGGDMDALKMLTTLASKNPEAQAKLEEIATE